MQHYDMPGRMSSIQLSKFILHDADTINDYKFLTNNNLLEVCDYKGNHLGDIHSVFGSENTFDKIQEAIEGEHGPLNAIKSLFSNKNIKPSCLDLFPKSLKDFEVISYDENLDGIVNYFSNLVNDGFTFNAEEIQNWKEHYEFFAEDAMEHFSEEDYEKFTEEELEQKVAENKNKFFAQLDSAVVNKASSSLKP